MPAATQRSGFFIALGTEPEAGPNTEKWSLKLKSVLWAPICALWLPTARAEPSRSLTITTIQDRVRIASRSLSAAFKSDWLSCHLDRANAFRLQLHALA